MIGRKKTSESVHTDFHILVYLLAMAFKNWCRLSAVVDKPIWGINMRPSLVM